MAEEYKKALQGALIVNEVKHDKLIKKIRILVY